MLQPGKWGFHKYFCSSIIISFLCQFLQTSYEADVLSASSYRYRPSGSEQILQASCTRSFASCSSSPSLHPRASSSTQSLNSSRNQSCNHPYTPGQPFLRKGLLIAISYNFCIRFPRFSSDFPVQAFHEFLKLFIFFGIIFFKQCFHNISLAEASAPPHLPSDIPDPVRSG